MGASAIRLGGVVLDRQDLMRVALKRPGVVQTRAFIGPPVAITPFADWDFHFLDKALTWAAWKRDPAHFA